VNPKQEALKARTKRFALDVLDLVEALLHQRPAVRIGWQLADAATSVGANDRAACRARSDAEFCREANELTAIFAASSITARQNAAAGRQPSLRRSG
jgi:hypothetical protein